MKRSVRFGVVACALAACPPDTTTDTEPTTPTDSDSATTPVDTSHTGTPPADTFAASISVLEAKVLNPGSTGTFFGQGIQVRVAFLAGDDLPGPVLEENPGSVVGCQAYEYTAAEAALAAIGRDEGSVQITMTGTVAPAGIPPCTFGAGAGYACVHAESAQTGGVIAAVGGGAYSLTDPDNTFTTTNTAGRYVQIDGAANAANDGLFPIVALASASALVFVNPLAVAETLPATATHVNRFGAGATPAVPDPGFLGDDTSVEIALTPAGEGHFATFTATTGGGTVGDDFALDLAEANTLNAIPVDGGAFTVSCAGCGAGGASASVLDLVTTDGPLDGLSPFAMPAPSARAVHVRCTAVGASAVTVPAAFSAHLAGAGATRIQATFARPTVLIGGPEGSTVSAGHAIVGFTTLPAR